MIAGAIQSFIFNISTFLSRKKIEKPVLFLNLLVLFLSLNNLQSWFIEKRLIQTEFVLHNFTFPWYVLILPMFYAFLVYYLGAEEKRFSFIMISLAVFLLEFFERTTTIFMVNTGTLPLTYLDGYNNLEDFTTLRYSLFLFYKAIQIVFKNDSLDTPISNFDDLVWLKGFFYLDGVVFVLWIMSIVFNTTGIVQKPYSYYLLRLGSSILIYWIVYQAFYRYVVLKDQISLRKEIRKKSVTKNLDRDGAVRGEVAFSEIDNYIVGNQKFLDPY